jgi:cytochrome c556
MADISIDEAKAKMWIDDVNAELDAVETILHKVNNSLATPVGEDDSIMEGISKVGEAMESAWTEMCRQFKEAQAKLPEVVNKIVKAAQDVIDNANELKSKVVQ